MSAPATSRTAVQLEAEQIDDDFSRLLILLRHAEEAAWNVRSTRCRSDVDRQALRDEAAAGLRKARRRLDALLERVRGAGQAQLPLPAVELE